MKISFIIASHNDSDSIKATLKSILENTFSGDQIILIDGGSSDTTVESAKSILKKFKNTKIISEPDDGIYDAWNKALKIVNCEWLVFLGCGDLLDKNYRKKISAPVNSISNINFISHKAFLYFLKNNENHLIRIIGKPFKKNNFIRQMKVCHIGAAHHITLFDGISFSTKYRIVSDYHLLIKVSDKIKPAFIDEPLVQVEASGISMRSPSVICEEYRMKQDISLRPKPILLSQLVWKLWKFYLFYLYDRVSIYIK